MGHGSAETKTSFSHRFKHSEAVLEQVYGLGGRVLYSNVAGCGVPFCFTGSYVSANKHPGSADNLITSLGVFGSYVVNPQVSSDDAQAHGRAITSATQGVRSIMSHLIKDSFPLGNVSGVFAPREGGKLEVYYGYDNPFLCNLGDKFIVRLANPHEKLSASLYLSVSLMAAK